MISIFLENYVTDFNVGIYEHEKHGAQALRFSIILTVDVKAPDYVDYDITRHAISQIKEQGHIDLLEIIAEKLMDTFKKDQRIRKADIKIEKLNVLNAPATLGIRVVRDFY